MDYRGLPQLLVRRRRYRPDDLVRDFAASQTSAQLVELAGRLRDGQMLELFQSALTQRGRPILQQLVDAGVYRNANDLVRFPLPWVDDGNRRIRANLFTGDVPGEPLRSSQALFRPADGIQSASTTGYLEPENVHTHAFGPWVFRLGGATWDIEYELVALVTAGPIQNRLLQQNLGELEGGAVLPFIDEDKVPPGTNLCHVYIGRPGTEKLLPIGKAIIAVKNVHLVSSGSAYFAKNTYLHRVIAATADDPAFSLFGQFGMSPRMTALVFVDPHSRTRALERRNAFDERATRNAIGIAIDAMKERQPINFTSASSHLSSMGVDQGHSTGFNWHRSLERNSQSRAEMLCAKMAIVMLIRHNCHVPILEMATSISTASPSRATAQTLADTLTETTSGSPHVHHQILDFSGNLLQEVFGSAIATLRDAVRRDNKNTPYYIEQEVIATVVRDVQRHADKVMSRLRRDWEAASRATTTDSDLANAITRGFGYLDLDPDAARSTGSNGFATPILVELKKMLGYVPGRNEYLDYAVAVSLDATRQLAMGGSDMVIGPTRRSERADIGSLELALPVYP